MSDDIFWDLISACSIAIIAAIERWDPSRGTYFYKFTKNFIWRACYNTYHNYNNQTRHSYQIIEQLIPLEDILIVTDSVKELTENHKIDEFSSQDEYDCLTKDLTRKEKKIIDDYIIFELTWGQIGKKYNIPTKALPAMHRELFQKIRDKYTQLHKGE